MTQFFFLDNDVEENVEEGGGEKGGGMAMLMRAMEREEREAGTLLMEQVRKHRHKISSRLLGGQLDGRIAPSSISTTAQQSHRTIAK